MINAMNYEIIKEVKWIININLRNYFLKNIIMMTGLIQKKKKSDKEKSSNEKSTDLLPIPPLECDEEDK